MPFKLGFPELLVATFSIGPLVINSLSFKRKVVCKMSSHPFLQVYHQEMFSTFLKDEELNFETEEIVGISS